MNINHVANAAPRGAIVAPTFAFVGAPRANRLRARGTWLRGTTVDLGAQRDNSTDSPGGQPTS